MGANYAWYYRTEDCTYYWTEAFNMSATQFANEVSVRVGKLLNASDISAADKRAYDRMIECAMLQIHIAKNDHRRHL